MNGNLNLNKAKQSSLQEQITEPNESETNNPTLFESENHLMPEGKALLIAENPDTPPPSQPDGGAMNPPPIGHDISAEPEVTV